MSGPEQAPAGPRRPSTEAAERLAAIVDAAERAALGVIDDAEKEARRYLEEAQARADRIVAERLREAAEELERGHEKDAPVSRLRSVDSDPSSARLLATQMAVSGSTRQEIEARLRNGFDIEDTTEILDAILGPEE